VNIGEALQFAEASIERIDAQYLLADLLNVGRASLIAHPERLLSERDEVAFTLRVLGRAKGTPVAYLIGKREFYGREFAVNAHVLIPRPETELLVEQALARLSGQKWPGNRTNARVLDLGTGSGAIAVTLALEYPTGEIVAVDSSPHALAVARRNAQTLFGEPAEVFSLSLQGKTGDGAQSPGHRHAPIEFIESNWYDALAGSRFDLIVSNPPYVAGNDSHLARGDLRFEPKTALTDDSADGLDSIRTIISGAAAHLQAGGWLLFEHGYDQADACRDLLLKAGFIDPISVKDLAGIPRVAGGQIR
jgi:release factor glutamine methyltransferase